ncbi:TPA: hypothetical protein NJ407_004131 [Vibrio parahaemolyticus]|nr:hypothetical protein [Vibrio parahaemolyticus]
MSLAQLAAFAKTTPKNHFNRNMSTQEMNVEQSQITKLSLTELNKLDPITVLLEDHAPSKGEITIKCFGKAWTAYWGGTGNRTVAEFFIDENCDYLVNCLGRGTELSKYEPDFDAYLDEMRQKVIEMRRESQISADLARELYDVTDWSPYVTDNPYEPIINPCSISRDEFDELDFGGFDVPEKISHEYAYLRNIVSTVKQGIQIAAKQELKRVINHDI